jgi:Zn finger protein HypA/HybF involved in hydrogenase expression
MNIRCENCNGPIDVPTAEPTPASARQEPRALEGKYSCPHCGSVIQIVGTVDGGYYVLLLSIAGDSDGE